MHDSDMKRLKKDGGVITDRYKSVKMDKIYYCDICHEKQGLQVRAQYDGKTIMGPWAWMCKEHFEELGVGLGLGRGQELIYENNT